MKKAFEKILEGLEEKKKFYDFFYKKGRSETDDIVKEATDVFYDEFVKIVQEAAEEYNGGWISCSERLPEEPKIDGNVEEDYVDGKLTEYIVMIYGAKKPTTLYYAGDGHWYDVTSQEYYPVIAWQQLPEQYKEVKKDEK